jgi:tripartite-type tricarboxylate transporter receptor subunit TctC
MPGAGGLTAIRHLANVAPRDGTVVIVPQVNIVQDGLLTPNPQYDPRDFQWIGRMAAQLQVGLVSSKSGVKSLEEAKAKELIAGGYGNNPTTLNPRLLNRLIGTKFKIVAGYKGTGAVMIAWERGEVDVVTTSWDFLFARYADQVKAKTAIPLYLNAPQRSPALPDVPLMTEFGQAEADKAFLQIYDSNSFIGRSLAAPPGVPKERVEAWRNAFMKMFDDPGFKESVRSGNLRLDPLHGDAMTSHLGKVASLPLETIAMAKRFYEEVLAQTN